MSSVSTAAIVRNQIQVHGIVQGVGFRPFVFNLAERLGLRGFVLNSSSGVRIEVEGDELAIEEFVRALRNEAPPLARIASIEAAQLPPLGYAEFSIQASTAQPEEFSLVSSDVATCRDCLRDFTDPENRRFGYPFTNCTNCGPRYTIVRDIPYDRPATTMAGFKMCEACHYEYEDPHDRRFHAQPNACEVCGPSVELVKSGSSSCEDVFSGRRHAIDVIRQVRKFLSEGQIVAIRGIGGFQLACDALNAGSVRRLRQRKRRSDKPFALMVADLAAAEELCVTSEQDRAALLGPEHPIVIMPRRPEATLPVDVAPGNNTVGMMLPYSPLHYLLFGDSQHQLPEFAALVMTSGNISEEPIVTSNEEAMQRLAGVADWFLLHNRDIYMRVDDSVARNISGRTRVLRRSRGYAPQPIDLGSTVQPILGCGAELKNAFCLTKDRFAILSQHIGDLENYETLRFFEESLNNLKKLFRTEPVAVAHDLHPGYLSSRYALSLDLPAVGVQHHHAHIASCMAENGMHERVIGVALDGTGYGTDGQIWGAEFLVADFAGFERRAHFRYVPLAGGDAAVRQPWRSALAYLRDGFGAAVPEGLPLTQIVPSRDLAVVTAMLERGLNTIQTSSCGRLFDAVASIIGIRQQVNFEGQAAIELEAEIASDSGRYPFEITPFPAEIDFRATIQAIIRDLQASHPVGMISARFHNTVVAAIVETCRRIREHDGLNKVCLSGGVFQNRYLAEHCVPQLESLGFEVFQHSRVPMNDGGIALGQVVIANEKLQRGSENVPGYSR